jgi:hypothetical protein
MAGKGRQRGGSARAKGAGVQIGKKQPKSNSSNRKSPSIGSGNRLVKDTGLAAKRRKLTNPVYAQNLPREGSEDSYEDSDEDEDDEDDDDDDDRHIRTPSSYNKGGRNRNGGKTHHGSSGSEGNDDAPVINKRKNFPLIHLKATVRTARTRAVSARMGTKRGRTTMKMAITAKTATMNLTARVMDLPTTRKNTKGPRKVTSCFCKNTMHSSMKWIILRNQLTLHRSTIANFRSATSESSVETSRNMFMTSITNHQVSLLVAEIFRTKKFAIDNVSSSPPPCSTSCTVPTLTFSCSLIDILLN